MRAPISTSYAAAGLPSGLAIDAATGVIGGTPDAADAGTATVPVTVTDAAGNTGTVDIVFPAVAKGTQSLSGFAYSPAAATAGGAAPTLSAPTGAVGALSYATGDADVCTVDAATGALTLVGAGECVITATAAGTADYDEATATFTVTVSAANAAATGEPSITGTARVDEVLTAALGTLADDDGLPATFPDDYAFQWVRVDGTDETDIEGATSHTYTLAAADMGKQLKVRVSFTDDEGNAEARTSAAYPGPAPPP